MKSCAIPEIGDMLTPVCSMVGTNAVTSASMGIPTIGFGPGEYKLAHMSNEHCNIDQIIDACRFYIRVIHKI